jgi:hypothetical protein
MLMTLLGYAGLRAEEAICAEVAHVNGTRLYVPARKVANHDRDVDLLPVVQSDLRAWLLASGIRSGFIVRVRAAARGRKPTGATGGGGSTNRRRRRRA